MFHLPADLRGQLLPCGPVGKQRSLGHDLLPLHGHLRKQMWDLFEGLLNRFQAPTGSLQQRHQLPQSRQRATWVRPHRHLLATVLTGHPDGDELSSIGVLDFELLDPSTAISADNRKLAPSMKGVQGIVDRHFARIAGIISGRVKESRLPLSAMRTSSTLIVAWVFFETYAMQYSTRTRKE